MRAPEKENPGAAATATGLIEKQLNAPEIAPAVAAGKADQRLPYAATSTERHRAALQSLAERMRGGRS